jgi:tripartite-type tricarboxylate transporter receptor subunit TctC
MRNTLRAAAALVLSCFAVAASAQGYPNKPIKLVVPWPPGQATDLSARLVAQKIAESLGQPLVIDNRPGAGGVIGSEVVAKSAADGYTLLAGSSGPISINPIVAKVSYDPQKAFAPVSLIATVPYVLVTHPAFPAADVKGFIALVRSQPGKYSFASSGTGATGHLVGELFNSMAHLQATHVPYKGSTPAVTDLMNGNVSYSFETLAAVVGHVKSGRLKAYGLSGARRNEALPELVPIQESAGLPGFDMAAWIGYLAPAGTPRDILARLSAEVRKAMQAADLRERYLALGMDAVSTTPEELGALMQREHERYSEIVKKANIRLE